MKRERLAFRSVRCGIPHQFFRTDAQTLCSASSAAVRSYGNTSCMPERLYTCACQKFGFGQPHQVSKVTWYRHLGAASSDAERQRILHAQGPMAARCHATQLAHQNQQDSGPSSSANTRIRAHPPEDGDVQLARKHPKQISGVCLFSLVFISQPRVCPRHTLSQTGEIPVIDDVATGLDYLGPVLDGDIKENDIVLMVSIDGAQLYEHQESDCWMYVWIIINLSPQKRYQKDFVQPGGYIPGPNKPNNLDAFLFPAIHHLSALQKEGLKIWDAGRNLIFQSNLCLLFPMADGPGLVYWDGMVGHSGKNGCRIYCGSLGRHKTHG